jgi:hypothetical protein
MNPSEESVCFHFEHSVAITQWAHVERELFNAVARCFDKEEYPQLALGFVSIENFRSKLSFSDRVIQRTFVGTKHIDDWLRIHDRLAACATNRNHLAHYRLHTYLNGESGRRVALIPWIVAKKDLKILKPPPGSICIRDLVKFRFEFCALFITLSNFGARLAGEKEQFPKSSEQPMRPMTIRQLTSHIHELLGHPQKSSREKRRDQEEKNAAASLLSPLTQVSEGTNG